ncbi:MAG: DUF6125 family protein [Desulfovibrionaceae bacterium]
MSDERIDSMDRETLLQYARTLLRHLRLADAFWFLGVEDRFGHAAACSLNEEVWARVGRLGARDILERFGPFQPGPAGFWDAYSLFPWTMMVDYRLEWTGQGLTVSCPSCPAQEGRKKHGLGEYDCKGMHAAEMAAFAAVIDPGLRVECLFAPPDPHPEDLYCAFFIHRSESA